MSGPWEKYQSTQSGPWEKYKNAQAPSAPEQEVLATTDDGGYVYRTADGAMGFTSPNYSTTDPETVARIMEGAKPAEIVQEGFDEQAIAQAPGTARAVKAIEGVPFVGSYVDEAVGIFSDKAKQGVRALSGAMDRQRGGESAALGVAGTVAGAVPMAIAAGPAIASRAAGTLGARALQGLGAGAVAGGIEGLVYGAGEGETTRERIGNAQEGAAFGTTIGAVTGVAAPYAAEAAKKTLQGLLNSRASIGQVAEALSITPSAARVVKNALDSGDMQAAEAALQRAGPDAMLADAGQPARELLDAASQKSGAAGRIARDAVEDRVSAASSRTNQVFDDVLGAPSGRDAMAGNVRQSTQAARSTAYDAAYAQPIDYSANRGRALEGLLTRVPGSAVRRANELMRAEGAQSAQIMAEISDDGVVTYTRLPDVRQIDYITRALNDIAKKTDGEGAMRGQTALGRAYQGLSRNIRNTLKGEVPQYGKALDEAADAIARVEAGEVGYGLLRAGTTRENVANALEGASKAERAAMKEGVRTYLDDTLANVASTLTDPNVDAREAVKGLRLFSTRANQTKMRMLLGKKEADKLFGELDEVATAFELRAALAQNSKTNIRGNIQQGVQDLAQPTALELLADGSPVQAGKRFVQVFTGNSADAQALREAGIYEQIATALTQTRGQKAKSALKIVERAQKGQRITEQQASFIGNVLATSAALVAHQQGKQRLSTP